MTDDPRARLADGQRLLDQAEPEAALPIFDALTTTPDPEVRGAALIGKGTAQYRMDDEAGRARLLAARRRPRWAAGLVRLALGRRAARPRRRPGGGDRRLSRGRSAGTPGGARRHRQPHRLAAQGDRPRLRRASPVQPRAWRLRHLPGLRDVGRSSSPTSSSSWPISASQGGCARLHGRLRPADGGGLDLRSRPWPMASGTGW